MPQSLHSELGVRHAQPRIRLSCIQPYRVILRWAGLSAKPTHVPDVKFLRLPRQQAFSNLFREPIWIGRRAESLACKNRRSLMMTMSVTIGARKAGDQDVRPKSANHPHHIAERDVVTL